MITPIAVSHSFVDPFQIESFMCAGVPVDVEDPVLSVSFVATQYPSGRNVKISAQAFSDTISFEITAPLNPVAPLNDTVALDGQTGAS